MNTRPSFILGALLWCAPFGCANDLPTEIDKTDAHVVAEDMSQDAPPDTSMDLQLVTWPEGLLGRPCDADADCATALGATCARLLGEQVQGVCTIEDCAAGGCPAGGRCATLGQTTACLPEAPDFCEVRCGDPLECALNLECFDRGCCGSGSCPSICGQMNYSDCEMSARCAASCCTP